MTPMKLKECEELAGALKILGWTPCMGKVMSFGEVVGYKIGVLVKVGDDRLKWVEPSKPKKEPEADQISHAGLSNFFASAHVVAKNRPLATQPIGFSSSMAGTDMVEISPASNESLKDFLIKIRKVSTMQVQIDLFAFESPSASPANTVAQPQALAVHGQEPERPISRIRP